MVHSCPTNGRKHQGSGSSWQRHHDCGNPSSDISSQESLRALAKHYGINQKTVAKWKPGSFVTDPPTGPEDTRSTVLSVRDEAIVVAFRRHTLLPLDDCL